MCAQQPASPRRLSPLRLRPWQRLRGGRAFARPKGVGVFAHGQAALVRILPPWEFAASAASVASAQASGDATASTASASATAVPAVAEVQRRLGVVASRKVGNAVVRNRAKRMFREIFRHRQYELPSQCDVLVIVRRGFVNADRSEVEALFADALRRSHRGLR